MKVDIISLLCLIVVQGVTAKPSLSTCEIVRDKDLPVSKQYGDYLVWSRQIVNFQQRIDACFSAVKIGDTIIIEIIDSNNGDVIAEKKFSNHLEADICFEFIASSEHKEFLVNFHIKGEPTVFHYIKICQTYLQPIVPVVLPNSLPEKNPTKTTTTTLETPPEEPPEGQPPSSEPGTIPPPARPTLAPSSTPSTYKTVYKTVFWPAIYLLHFFLCLL